MTSLTQSLLARHNELADAARIALVAAQAAAISCRTHNLGASPTTAWRICHRNELAIAAMDAHGEAYVAKELYLEALAASAQPLVGSLATPQNRIECRDAATQAWHEWDEDGDQPLTAFVCDAIRALGLTVGYAEWSNYGKPLTVVAGTKQIVLEWDPMIDGFDYEGSTEDAEALEASVKRYLRSADGDKVLRLATADECRVSDGSPATAGIVSCLVRGVRVDAYAEALKPAAVAEDDILVLSGAMTVISIDSDDTEDTTCTCGDKRGMGTDDDGACRDCGGYA